MKGCERLNTLPTILACKTQLIWLTHRLWPSLILGFCRFSDLVEDGRFRKGEGQQKKLFMRKQHSPKDAKWQFYGGESQQQAKNKVWTTWICKNKLLLLFFSLISHFQVTCLWRWVSGLAYWCWLLLANSVKRLYLVIQGKMRDKMCDTITQCSFFNCCRWSQLQAAAWNISRPSTQHSTHVAAAGLNYDPAAVTSLYLTVRTFSC